MQSIFAEHTGDKVGEKSNLGNMASAAADTVRKAVNDSKAAVTGQYDTTTKWMGNMTRTKPLRTLGVAAVVGVVIGLFMGRR